MSCYEKEEGEFLYRVHTPNRRIHCDRESVMERKSRAPVSTQRPSAKPSKPRQPVAGRSSGADQGAVVPLDGAELHSATNDVVDPQPGGSMVKKMGVAISPRRAKPIVAYVRDVHEKRVFQAERDAAVAVPTPLSSLSAKGVPRRRSKNCKVWTEPTFTSSEFDFPSELPLPKLSSRRDQRDSRSEARNKKNYEDANSDGAPCCAR
ncbi:hypothetical protein MTO96_006953 [Rhipicephalus appendiculatus]